VGEHVCTALRFRMASFIYDKVGFVQLQLDTQPPELGLGLANIWPEIFQKNISLFNSQSEQL